MHDLLKLTGTFLSRANESAGGGVSLPADAFLSATKVYSLADELERLLQVWQGSQLIKDILIDVEYIKLVAKSNRVQSIFIGDKDHPNRYVVGARFSEDNRHIITYYVTKEMVRQAIHELKCCARYIDEKHGGQINRDVFNLNNGENEKDVYLLYGLARTNLRKLVVDAYYIARFAIPNVRSTDSDDYFRMVTLYKTEKTIFDIFHSLGIKGIESSSLHSTNSAVIDRESYEKLCSKAPYLIAMAYPGSFAETLQKTTFNQSFSRLIPEPKDEPTIGVIDTYFDRKVYFSAWVDAENRLPEDYVDDSRDYEHGTKVSSILVDGPSLNPALDDHCGRFKVKHFGLMGRGKTPTFNLMDEIETIVAQNQKISVWNLCLGGVAEINRNFISYEASVLDRLQVKYKCIFVVAGTNDGDEKKRFMSYPADSLNSLVVGSVNTNKEPCTYSRHGPVLSNFIKPDVCYYGGDYGVACTAVGPDNKESFFQGTSSATPWIARKMCYLIDVMGFPREVAKAIIIDSAAGWNKDEIKTSSRFLGYGVVPITIEEVLRCKDHEIRFYIHGKILNYKTYNYGLPIPKDKNGDYPYMAKATMCYFSQGDRQQGVDYTSTELALRFGRLDGKGKIKSVKAVAAEGAEAGFGEDKLRQFYRKWDNVKVLYSDNVKEVQSYEGKKWGIEIEHNERQGDGALDDDLVFGVVITLKEVNGVDRIKDFIDQCILNQWIVSSVSIEERIDVYSSSQNDVDIDFGGED